MSCCQTKNNACAKADNQVLICQVGTETTQTVIQLNKIRYTSTLPGVSVLTALRVGNIGSWVPALRDSNGNAPPLNVDQTYCVKNASCRIAKFGINIDGSDVLPPVSLEKNAFIVFTPDAASIQDGDIVFGTCCPDTAPKSCSKKTSVSNYNGGRSPGIVTCSLPQQKRCIPSFQVANSCCSNCN